MTRALTDKDRKNLIFLDILRKNGPISRTDISRMTSFNIVTVSNYINHYIEKGLVVEKEFDISTGGRKPVLVSFNRESGFILGVSFTHNQITGMVADLECRTVYETKQEQEELKRESVEEVLVQFIDALIKGAKIAKEKIRGIGLVLPGAVDQKKQWFPRDGSVKGRDASGPFSLETLEKKLELPLFVESDINASALAEKWLGLSADVQHVLYFRAGIGVGIVIDGEIYRGANGFAGELAGGSEKEQVVQLVNLLNPEFVVIGGGSEKLNAALFDGIKLAIKENGSEAAAANVKVIPSAFGDKASLWGAVGMVCREFYKSA